MVSASVKRWSFLLLWAAIGTCALLLLAKSAQNSGEFSRLQPWILLLNVIGVVGLSVLLTRKLWQLVRDYRAHVPGSRLTARTVGIFGVLVAAPLLIVYLFSLEFLNRGIDSWFRNEVKQNINDALVLSRAALDVRMREYAGRTERFARSLDDLPASALLERLDYERRVLSAVEIAVYGSRGLRIAASTDGETDAQPLSPPPDLVRQVSAKRPYVMVEPRADGLYFIRAAAPIGDPAGSDDRYVMAIYEVPQELSALSEAVQRAYSQYGDLAASREPLKYSFRLTLTLVLLLALLAAIYGALFSAQRLTRPVQDLIAGTRAVGKGDFGTRLPLPSRDEMGFLVHSFNDMTKRLRRAHEDTTRSQQIAEREKQRLAIILARLSSGVLVVDRDLNLIIANEAASSILGANLSAETGRSLAQFSAPSRRLALFSSEVGARLAADRVEWREQLDLQAAADACVLMCTCTPLPAEEGRESAYVVVFDDITALLSAQRDAAWGEVARRLAHEIKNPLTPIQLSAERMRRRFLGNMNPGDAAVLERATQTIVQQVESMKQMVNAFSEYARAPDMALSHFSLNQLVAEVAELYRAEAQRIDIKLLLDPQVDSVEADRGRIRQILNNLLTNALEALEGVNPALLQISTRREELAGKTAAAITVSDNGPGFQRDMLGRVFDPYVTSKPRGTGLGLAIVKKIVEEHGGRIDADNGPEGGARVSVLLPVENSMRSAPGARERRTELRKERRA